MGIFRRKKKDRYSYIDYLGDRSRQMIENINSKGDDIGRETKLWLVRAFALMFAVIGILNFATVIMHYLK